LWYGEPNAVANAIGYAMHSSRSHDAVIRVYDDAGNVIETHEQLREQKTPKAVVSNTRANAATLKRNSHCRFVFQKRGQLLIGAHNKAFAVAMRISDPDRSPFPIQR